MRRRAPSARSTIVRGLSLHPFCPTHVPPELFPEIFFAEITGCIFLRGASRIPHLHVRLPMCFPCISGFFFSMCETSGRCARPRASSALSAIVESTRPL